VRRAEKTTRIHTTPRGGRRRGIGQTGKVDQQVGITLRWRLRLVDEVEGKYRIFEEQLGKLFERRNIYVVIGDIAGRLKDTRWPDCCYW